MPIWVQMEMMIVSADGLQSATRSLRIDGSDTYLHTDVELDSSFTWDESE